MNQQFPIYHDAATRQRYEQASHEAVSLMYRIVEIADRVAELDTAGERGRSEVVATIRHLKEAQRHLVNTLGEGQAMAMTMNDVDAERWQDGKAFVESDDPTGPYKLTGTEADG